MFVSYKYAHNTVSSANNEMNECTNANKFQQPKQ